VTVDWTAHHVRLTDPHLCPIAVNGRTRRRDSLRGMITPAPCLCPGHAGVLVPSPVPRTDRSSTSETSVTRNPISRLAFLLTRGDAVGEYDNAVRACRGDQLCSGAEDLVGAVLVDARADSLIHPHAGATGSAAERGRAVAWHLDEPHAGHAAEDLPWRAEYPVVAAQVAGVMVGDRGVHVVSRDEPGVRDKPGQQLRMVHRLVDATELRVVYNTLRPTAARRLTERSSPSSPADPTPRTGIVRGSPRARPAAGPTLDRTPRTDQRRRGAALPALPARQSERRQTSPGKPPPSPDEHIRVRQGRTALHTATARAQATATQRPTTGNVNTTDPASRIMPGKSDGFDQRHNIQALACKNQFIIAIGTHDGSNDKRALTP
jgi:hypothetical protein